MSNREYHDQTASSEAVKKQSGVGLHCLFRPLWQATDLVFEILEHLPFHVKIRYILFLERC